MLVLYDVRVLSRVKPASVDWMPPWLNEFCCVQKCHALFLDDKQKYQIFLAEFQGDVELKIHNKNDSIV